MLSVILALSLSPTLALAQSSQDGDIGASVAVTEPAAAPANEDTGSTAAATTEGSAAMDSAATSESTATEQEGQEASEPTVDQAEASAASEPAAESAASKSVRAVAKAPAKLTELWVDGGAGSDTNNGSASAMLKTLAKAIELQKANADITKIHIQGSLPLTAPVTIPSGITLIVESAGATVTGSGNSINGITLASGSTLTGTGTLTMTGFSTALIEQQGATITDGTYVFKDNAGASGTRGLSLGGTVKGSGGKSSLTITANDKSETNFYESGTTFENCTVSATSQTRTWFDARDVNLVNASLTVAGFDQTYYVNKLTMDNSELTIGPAAFYGATGMTIQGATSIKNSTINATSGYRAGISVGVSSGSVDIVNSTLNFTNGGIAGLNDNTGIINFTDSTIIGDGNNYGALYGAQTNGTINFMGNCLVETPQANDYDNGAGQTGTNIVVTGGSYLIKYAPDYNAAYGSTIPVNGPANGNEQLSLFTLVDASTNALQPLNKNGRAYDYSVAKASSDGDKHVWVPAAKVTFQLNADDANPQEVATFADGTTANKTALAIRGYALSEAKSVAGGSVEVPADPTSEDSNFLGWYYKDAQGQEQAFDPNSPVISDMTVYAKWESKTAMYTVSYHNGGTPDVVSTFYSNYPSRTVTVESLEWVEIQGKDGFNLPNKVFKGWNTKPDGTGEMVPVGSTLSVPPGTPGIDLYAVWQDIQTVKATIPLPSDMYCGSIDNTTSIKEVKVGDTFSITGAIEAQGIVGQMDALERNIAGGLDDLTKITLSDTTSSFSATITLPQGVVVPSDPTVKVTGLGNCFDVDKVTVDGQKVTVGFKLKGDYANYKQLKDAVVSTGGFDSVTARMKMSLAAQQLSKPITATVEGLTLDSSKVSNGQQLTATGVVKGSFSSTAMNTVSGTVKHFDFTWNGQQIAANRDPLGTGLQQTLLVVKPTSTNLPADILVGKNTEHDAVYPVIPGQSIDFTGSIDAATVKAQMKGIEMQFPGTTDYAGIALSDLSSSFTATFTVPDDMTLPDNLTKDSVQTQGFGDTFSVTDVTVNGKTVTVQMTLKDGIATYKDLQHAVIDNLGDTMKVTIPGVKIDDNFAAGKTATVSGTVSGTFSAHATKTATGTTKVFDFSWQGVQSNSGMDATARSVDNGILFTVQAVSPMDAPLPGDMLVGANTEHDAVIKAAQGSTFDLTGAFDAKQIQAQMADIEAVYPNARHDSIAIGIQNFNFTATFTVPNGITLPEDLDASKVSVADFGDGFKVQNVKAEGKTVTVAFALSDPAAIKTYSDLEKIVDAAGGSDGWMKITVPGLSIDKDAKVGSNLTIVGTVDGAFSATAESDAGTHNAFSFIWKATQWPEGEDAVATDDSAIQLTLQVTEPAPAPQPQPNPTSGTDKNDGSNQAAQPNPPSGSGSVTLTKERKANATPATGDSMMPLVCAGAALLGAAGVALTALLRRGRRN